MEQSMLLLSGLVAAAPQMTAALVGIAIAAVLWHRAPRAAKLLLIASLMETAVLMASCWYHFVYFPAELASHSKSVTELSVSTSIVTLATSVLRALAFGLMIWAVAAGRKQPSLPPAPTGR